MTKQQTYDVHASLTPAGRAERVNTLNHRTFVTIDRMFADHNDWRWLILTKTDDAAFYVIDLWQNIMVEDFPYVSPYFINHKFHNVDQAIGYINLELVS